VKGQPEKMSLELCSKLTATDGRGAKVKWQWVPDNWCCDEEVPPYTEDHHCLLVKATKIDAMVHWESSTETEPTS